MAIRTRLAPALGLLAAAGPGAAAEVVVHWERGSYWPGTAFEDFTKATGIPVTFPVKGENNEGYEAIEV